MDDDVSVDEAEGKDLELLFPFNSIKAVQGKKNAEMMDDKRIMIDRVRKGAIVFIVSFRPAIVSIYLNISLYVMYLIECERLQWKSNQKIFLAFSSFNNHNSLHFILATQKAYTHHSFVIHTFCASSIHISSITPACCLFQYLLIYFITANSF